MTQLMKERPWAVWCLFLAGAITGGLSSALFQQPNVWAEPGNLNGQKFENLEQLVAAHNVVLDGITRTESGGFFFHKPVTAIELLVGCPAGADSARPALRVCGRAEFTGDAGPDHPLVAIDPLMFHDQPQFVVKAPTLFTGDPGPVVPLVAIDLGMIHEKPEFVVKAPTLFTGDTGGALPLVSIDPLMIHGTPEFVVKAPTQLVIPDDLPDSFNLLELSGSLRSTKINPFGIELLVANPDAAPVVEASLISDDDEGSRLNVGRIDADTIRGESIEEYPVFDGDPPDGQTGPF